MSVDVIITGCALYDQAQERAVWGDLWHAGTRSEEGKFLGAWIFNACLDRDGQANWDTSPTIHSELRYLEINLDFPYFERRGVIVMPTNWCTLSPAARRYLKLFA